MHDWPQVAAALNDQGLACDPARPPRPVGGGDISAAWRLETASGPVFLKSAPAGAFEMLDAEREALAALDAAGAVRVPRPLACCAVADSVVLALEWLDLSAPDAGANRLFGRQLAELHRHTADRHGWHRDNTIGATPQPNAEDHDWVRFFREQRLLHQLALASRQGYGGDLEADGRRLADRLERLFDGYAPEASLLHGDLWGGNWAVSGGEPVVFDPALHYGDRECDLAMTRLFGGFSGEFYRAYEARWPLAPGHEARQSLYQLYHVLNHLNLFGGAYLGRARQLLAELLRATA